MAVWIIEPHDPLIVRDGRPFGPNPGVQARSLSFPFPSTTTGGVRTRAGLSAPGGFDRKNKQSYKDNVERVKKIMVRGPLLVQLRSDDTSDELEEWLFPAPLDVLLVDDEQTKATIRKQLVPLKIPENWEFNLESPNRQQTEKLTLVGLSKPDPRKPAKSAPQYWYWKQFLNWLLDPAKYNEQPVNLTELGHEGPQRERRIHVSIDEYRLVGKDGALFGTSGLEFTSIHRQEHRLSSARRLALAVAVDNGTDLTIAEGLGSLGGERRTLSWRKSSSGLPLCPKEIEEEIVKQKACRIILLTPACFNKGYLPERLLEEKDSVKPQLKAIATQRPQVVSGWDFERQGPKPTRRLAPAGTVLFLSLKGEETARRNWIRNIWMQCISDDPQDNADGFGLAVLGTWPGKPVTMQKGQ